jgi:hypothetical protein
MRVSRKESLTNRDSLLTRLASSCKTFFTSNHTILAWGRSCRLAMRCHLNLKKWSRNKKSSSLLQERHLISKGCRSCLTRYTLKTMNVHREHSIWYLMLMRLLILAWYVSKKIIQTLLILRMLHISHSLSLHLKTCLMNPYKR